MAPLHLNIIIFFSFIFATLSSSFAPSRHPFDPLTETELELKLIQNIINKTYPISPSHKFTFQYVGLNEPDKSLVLSWYSSPKQHQPATTSGLHHRLTTESLERFPLTFLLEPSSRTRSTKAMVTYAHKRRTRSSHRACA